MFTKDERNLEKYIDQHFYISDLSPEKWEFYYNETIKQVFLTYEPFEEDLKYYEENKREIEKFLKDILLTPRQIKSFGRHLKRKLSTEAGRTVNFADVVCLISIEATNPRLYFWLMQNKTLLIPNIDHLDQYLNEKEKEKKENYRDEIKRCLEEEDNCHKNEINLVLYIFSKKQEKDKLFHKRRVTEELYFSNYFFRDTIPYILTPIGEDELRSKLDGDPNNETVFKLLDSEIENGIKNNKDHVGLILNQTKKIILSEKFYKGYCLLVNYGKILKKYHNNEYFPLIFHEFILWDLLEKFPEKRREILINIFDYKVSDKLLTSALFYSISKDRRYVNINLGEELISEIKERFVLKYKRILEPISDEFIDIFLSDVVDDPIDVLFRYRDVQDDNKKTSNYLIKLFKKEPKHIIDFLNIFHFKTRQHTTHLNGESIESLSYLINIDDFINLEEDEEVLNFISSNNEIVVIFNIIKDSINK